MLSKPVPVRFSADVDDRLNNVAQMNGIKKAELIRICVEKFLHEVETTGKNRGHTNNQGSYLRAEKSARILTFPDGKPL